MTEKQKQFLAFARFLAKTVSKKWTNQNPEIVAAWWSGFPGNAFRAGLAYGKRKRT